MGSLGAGLGSAASSASQWLNTPAFGAQMAQGPMASGAAGVPMAGTGITYGDLLSAARGGGQGLAQLGTKAANQGMIPGITGMQGEGKGSGDQALGAILSLIPYLI